MLHVARLGLLTLAVATAMPAGAQTIALDFTGGSLSFNTFNTTGWSFTVADNYELTVDTLLLFDVGSDGFVEAHNVALWDDSNGTQITPTYTFAAGSGATAYIGTSGDGLWRTMDVADFVLQAGTYVIGTTGTPSEEFRRGATATTMPQITFGEFRANAGSGGFGYPGTSLPSLNDGLFGPSFLVSQVTEVPEPCSLALIASLAGCMRRRARVWSTTINDR